MRAILIDPENRSVTGRQARRWLHREAMRRARQRASEGVVVVNLPVTQAQTAKLKVLYPDLLSERDLENRTAISLAVSAALDAIEPDDIPR